MKEMRQAEKEKRERERIKPEWGGGVKQMMDKDRKAQELKEAANTPFARYKCVRPTSKYAVRRKSVE
eukprot:9140207-Pyramimonas_sp.AAC.1